MADFRGNKKYAYYNFFMVGNAASKYKLQVAGYSGTAGDSIEYRSGAGNLNGMAFSTYDNDSSNGGGCAQQWKGGWWYNSCMYSQLNGIYHHDTTPRAYETVLWETFIANTRSLKFAEMQLRARD